MKELEKRVEYKTTPAEEAHILVVRELTNAELKLREMNVPQTAENLILMFSQGVQQMLTGHLKNYREFLEGTNSRELELVYWIQQVSLMMDAVIEYRDSLNLQQDTFIDKAKAAFIQKTKEMIKPNYN